MKHTFQSGNTTTICKICGRNEFDHSDIAQCEACVNIGPCEVIGSLLLCASCYDLELRVTSANDRSDRSDRLAHDPRAERITKLINRLTKEQVTDARQYFVKTITAITDIELELNTIFEETSPEFNSEEQIKAREECARIVDNRLFEMRKRLYLLKNEAIEIQVDMTIDQKYLNMIVPTLRLEAREKFKNYDISYKPAAAVATTTASKPRQSASDKAIESYAKMLGISVDAARISMANAMKNVTGAVCTCKETPGLCRVHPK